MNGIVCSVHWILSQAYASLDDTDAATAHVLDAISIAKVLGDDDAAAHFLNYLDQLNSKASPPCTEAERHDLPEGITEA
jgi:hypothetical protein